MAAAAVLATSGLGYVTLSAAAPPPAAGCSDVQVVQLRGTGEAAGAGVVPAAVGANVVKFSAKTIDQFALDYPATADAAKSVPAGVAALAAHLQTQSQGCPNQKFALVGYEQGAAVLTTAIAGNAAAGIQPTPPAAMKYIAAIILMKDPGHTTGEIFNAGTATVENGTAPRGAGAMGAFGMITQDFCDTGDTTCAAGKDAALDAAHYSTMYAAKACAFIVGEIGG